MVPRSSMAMTSPYRRAFTLLAVIPRAADDDV
jgi:hypothetical protein